MFRSLLASQTRPFAVRTTVPVWLSVDSVTWRDVRIN